MPKATIHTIATAAGVSTATVDRALNGRAGVSAVNRQRVLSAARDLGYLPTEGIVVLPARPAHLSFLIPFGQNAFMADVSRCISDFAADLPMVASCRIVEMDGIGPDSLLAALESLSLATQGVGIITTDHPRSRAAIRRLCESGVRVVTLASDVLTTPRAAYVGVDNHAAGRTAAQLLAMLTAGAEGSVALFLGARTYHGHREREAGFLAYMAERCPHLRILPAIETGEVSARACRSMSHLLAHTPDLRAVYCIGAGRRGIVEALADLPRAARPAVVIHDLTDSSATWLREERIDAVIDQNARLVGEQAVIRLLGAIAASTPLLPVKDIEARVILRENLPGSR